MAYTKVLIKKLAEGKSYYSYDKDDYSDLYNKLKERYPNKNWIFTTDLETIPKDEPITLLAMEIIEHNPVDEALELLLYVKNNWNVKQIVLSTPNVTFNKYYQISTLRREDHVQELDYQEFIRFIRKLGGTRVDNIGDVISGEPVTFGAVIEYEY
jgi:hypothetical protein